MYERQTSFAGGEFAPGLWGRSDYNKYASGAKTLKNFIVAPHGAALSRPGAQFIGQAAGGSTTRIRLVPFVYDERVQGGVFMVEFGHLTLSIRNGWTGLPLDPPVTKVTAYTEAQLRGLRFCQVGKIMTIVHPDHAPAELTWDGSSTWTYGPIDFSPYDFPTTYGGTPLLVNDPKDEGGEVDQVGVNGIAVAPWRYKVTRILDVGGVLYETMPFEVVNAKSWKAWPYRLGQTYYIGQNAFAFTVIGYIYSAVATTSSMPADYTGATGTGWVASSYQFYQYNVTDYPPLFAITPATPATISWQQTVKGDWNDDTDWVENGVLADPLNPPTWRNNIYRTRVYKGIDGRFGLIGETEGESFKDDGIEPNWAIPPPSGTNPFDVKNDLGVLLRTEEPSTVCMFEGRRWFGGTAERPGYFWGSAVDDYDNFDQVVPAKESDSVEAELASNRVEAIREMVPGRALLVLTNSSEWEVTGAGSALVTPNSISAHPVGGNGCGGASPIQAPGTLFYLRGRGSTPMAMNFSAEGGGYQSMDLSVVSGHFFLGHTIVEWAWQLLPYPILWAVRDDGELFSMTWEREQGIYAWSQHDLGCTVDSVCIVPGQTEDLVYVSTDRDSSSSRLVERFSTRIITDVREAVCLDASVVYDGRNTTVNTLTITDTYSEGMVLDARVRISFSAETVPGEKDGKIIQLDDIDGGEPGRFQITAHNGASVYEATIIVTPENGWDFATAYTSWAICSRNISGLTHLEGQEVYALADGNVMGPFTVASGEISLCKVEEPELYAAIACVGIQYNCDFESLNSPHERGKEKTVREVSVEYEGSRGGWVGNTLDGDLQEIKSRIVEHRYAEIPLLREEKAVPVPASWSKKGSVAFRQVDPVPVSIVGIARKVEVAGG